jgi:hypothetical protein
LFVPVFWQGFQDEVYLRFTGFSVNGASSACMGSVFRVTEGADLPLWINLQAPPEWAHQRLYQTLRTPGSLAWLLSKSFS